MFYSVERRAHCPKTPANTCGKNEEGNKAWLKLCAEPSSLGQQEGFKATKNIFAEEKENILPAG